MGHFCPKTLKIFPSHRRGTTRSRGEVEPKIIQNLSRGTPRPTRFRRTKRGTERLVPSRPTPSRVPNATKGNTKVRQTPGCLLWFSPWYNIQYVATATFATIVYSNYLATKHASLNCAAGNANPSDLIAFVKSQVDYILGSNPKNMSYMIGYGGKYPQRIHHRGASIISIKKDSTPVTCKGGYADWFNREAVNPNVLDGAVVSPNENDGFSDDRSNFQLGEPTTYNNGPLVGVLAHFA